MAFCHTCQRNVYLPKNQDPYCPVCSEVLVPENEVQPEVVTSIADIPLTETKIEMVEESV